MFRPAVAVALILGATGSMVEFKIGVIYTREDDSDIRHAIRNTIVSNTEKLQISVAQWWHVSDKQRMPRHMEKVCSMRYQGVHAVVTLSNANVLPETVGPLVRRSQLALLSGEMTLPGSVVVMQPSMAGIIADTIQTRNWNNVLFLSDSLEGLQLAETIQLNLEQQHFRFQLSLLDLPHDYEVLHQFLLQLHRSYTAVEGHPQVGLSMQDLPHDYEVLHQFLLQLHRSYTAVEGHPQIAIVSPSSRACMQRVIRVLVRYSARIRHFHYVFATLDFTPQDAELLDSSAFNFTIVNIAKHDILKSASVKVALASDAITLLRKSLLSLPVTSVYALEYIPKNVGTDCFGDDHKQAKALQILTTSIRNTNVTGETGFVAFDKQTGMRTNYTLTLIDYIAGTGFLSPPTVRKQDWLHGHGFLPLSDEYKDLKPNFQQPKKKRIRVTTIFNAPFVTPKANAFDGAKLLPNLNESHVEGYCVDLFNLISTLMPQYTFELRIVRDFQYGSSQADGDWNGMIGAFASLSAVVLMSTSSQLPPSMIVHIMKHLDTLSDRRRASTVNRVWMEAYSSRGLWNDCEFDLTHSDDCSAVVRHAHFVRHLSVRLDQSVPEQRNLLTKLCSALSKLEQKNVRSLSVVFTGFNPLLYSGSDVLPFVETLLKSLSATFHSLDLHLLPLHFSDSLITAVSECTALRRLNLQTRQISCDFSAHFLEQIVNSCRNLKDLRVRYSSIRPETIGMLPPSILHLSLLCTSEAKYVNHSTLNWQQLFRSNSSIKISLIADCLISVCSTDTLKVIVSRLPEIHHIKLISYCPVDSALEQLLWKQLSSMYIRAPLTDGTIDLIGTAVRSNPVKRIIIAQPDWSEAKLAELRAQLHEHRLFIPDTNGELLHGEADIAMASLTITRARERVVDFSKPFLMLGISIMITKPEKQEYSVFSFMSPLSPRVWFLCIIAYGVVSVCIFLISHISPFEWTVVPPLSEKVNSLRFVNEFSFNNSFWFTGAAFLQQTVDILPKSMSLRIASAAWWFFTMIIVSSYTANLAAFLTLDKVETPIRSVEELANQDKIAYGIQGGGSTADFFKHSRVETYKKMWRYMSTNPDVFVKNYAQGIQRVRDSTGRYAFLLESSANEYINQRKPCNTMKVGQNLNSIGYGIATPFGSPLRGKINLAILELHERGELKRLENKWWYDKSECIEMEAEHRSQSLNISKVAGVFYILIGGSIGSMLISLAEHLISGKWANLKKKVRRTNPMAPRPRRSLTADGNRRTSSTVTTKTMKKNGMFF